MRARLIRTTLLLAAAVLSDCQVFGKVMGLPDPPRTLEGQLTPPAAGTDVSKSF